MSKGPIRLLIENEIAFFELCCPPGNVMNASFFEWFRILWNSLTDHPVRGMVVCSSGRHFSSGADIDEIESIVLRQSEAQTSELFFGNHLSFESLAQTAFPVVAAITGCCLGAGLELALACHYRVATRNAVFSLPEVTFGLMPGCGGTVRLPALVGAGKAMELSLSGRTFGADEALACGIVDLVVEKKALLATAAKVIEKVVQFSLNGQE
jgi:enoyl-CoA hydratase/carnithine racemase